MKLSKKKSMALMAAAVVMVPASATNVEDPDAQRQPGTAQHQTYDQTRDTQMRDPQVQRDTTVQRDGTMQARDQQMHRERLDTAQAPTVYVDNRPVSFTQTRPGLRNDELFIPVREFAEQLGGEVHWLHEEKTAVIHYSGQVYHLTAQGHAYDANRVGRAYNGQRAQAGQPGQAAQPGEPGYDQQAQTQQNRLDRQVGGTGQVIIVDDRAYKGLDQLAQLINADARWDRDQGEAHITITDVDATMQPGDRAVTRPEDRQPGTTQTGIDRTAQPRTGAGY